MNRFRPQSISTRYKTKQRRVSGKAQNYNWQSRVTWYPAGWKPNHISIARRFDQLHYLACHAPEPIKKKWRKAYQVFYKKHFGANHISVRYANRYTCHAWL